MESKTGERLDPNPLEYPIEYFDAQVQFARKWSQLSGISFADALLNYTALYRRICNGKFNLAEYSDSLWDKLLKKIEKDPNQATQLLYDAYSSQPHALYKPTEHAEDDPKHFGFFSYDYYPPSISNGHKKIIKIHFNNTQRGQKSGLHPDFRAQRKADLVRMFRYIYQTHKDAEEVIGGSWLYNLDGYRENFPEEYLSNGKRIVPVGFESDFPDSVTRMSFGGNSLWGQFINRNGYVREPAYTTFIAALAAATNPKDMIAAFPDYPIQPRAAIGVFYDFLGIGKE